jgi:sulfatase modifying factor 1
MRRKVFIGILVSAVLAMTSPPSSQTVFAQAQPDSGKRVALVIGNGAYQHVQTLRNPVNDAQDMTATFKRMGYTVISSVDLDRRSMRVAIDEFNEAIQGAAVALFYYSGHGVQVAGENYLVPIGAEVVVSGDVPDECVSLTRITSRMNEAGAGMNVIILDACRDNPFRGVTRGIDRGLAALGEKPPDSIIVYATAENERAEDGEGRNGTFTAALLKHIERRESFMDILLDVNVDVRKATGNKQIPAIYQNLSQKVYLAGKPDASPTAPPSFLVKGYGSIFAIAASSGTLYMDGALRGELPAGTMARLDSVETGDRVVEMRYPNGEVETMTVNIGNGSLVTVRFTKTGRVVLPQILGEMVLVKGGSFMMGSNSGTDEKPPHEVQVSDFYIGRYEVTQAQYRRVTGKSPSYFSGDSLPVEQVSWHEAIAFCNALSEQEGLRQVYTISGATVSADFGADGYRLPTEAEWEYAARGGEYAARGGEMATKGGATFAGSTNVDQVAWYDANSGNTTHPVGQKDPNALGLYDMSGNVWEWCWDLYGWYDLRVPLVDPQGPRFITSYGTYVHRGGSWDFSATIARSTNRGSANPDSRASNLGFRLARRP